MRLTQPLTELPEQTRRIPFLLHAVSYRIAVPVTHMVQYSAHGTCYPLCPRCKTGMDREYASFCDRCGQKLNWDKIEDAKIMVAPVLK